MDDPLEADLAAAFYALQLKLGQTGAVQAMGRILSSIGMMQPPAHPSKPTMHIDIPKSGHASSEKGPISPFHAASVSPGSRDGRDSSGRKTPRGDREVQLFDLPSTQQVSSNWKKAVKAALRSEDPWADRGIQQRPMEIANRIRFDPRTREWITDPVIVRMEEKPFAAGAMRECYALKKLSKSHNAPLVHDWSNHADAQNCVAKRYIHPVSKRVYFTDVLVQMDAKHLGEEYSKTNPPKKLDFIQASLLQFPDRPGQPLFCIENLIEGDYIKYNSNSGAVFAGADGSQSGAETLRNTPQAFSHYTWDLTMGNKICVDVQGVGDLYTDPQIHTLDGENYGEGNLGIRGIALFFRTHQCNPLCKRLQLCPFERCDADSHVQGFLSVRSSAQVNQGGTQIKRSSMRKGLKKKSCVRKGSVAPALSEPDILAQLKDVPLVECPEALVHFEITKIYTEHIILPDLRPDESVEDSVTGGMFHLMMAAKKGCRQAITMLARAHLGLDPAILSFSALINAAKASGEFTAITSLAFRYGLLAADRGVKAAIAAIAFAFKTGEGLGEHLEEPDLYQAKKYYEILLQKMNEPPPVEEEEEEDDDDSLPVMKGGQGGMPRSPSTLESEMMRSLSWVSQDVFNEAERIERMQKKEPASAATTSATPATPRLSRLFVSSLSEAAEAEAAGLPGSSPEKHEVLSHLGEIYLEEEDFVKAAELFNAAAEEAQAKLKAKLAMKYLEKVAEAEGMIEEEGEGPDEKEEAKEKA